LLGLNPEERRIQLVTGDVLDRNSLVQAMNGVDYVVCTIGAGQIRFKALQTLILTFDVDGKTRSRFWLLDYLPDAQTPLAHPRRIDYEGVLNVVDVAKGLIDFYFFSM